MILKPIIAVNIAKNIADFTSIFPDANGLLLLIGCWISDSKSNRSLIMYDDEAIKQNAKNVRIVVFHRRKDVSWVAKIGRKIKKFLIHWYGLNDNKNILTFSFN